MKLKAVIALLFSTLFLKAVDVHVVTHPPGGTSVPTGRNSSAPELSADGRWLVFLSDSDQLVTNTTKPGVLNVFLRNNESGELRLLTQGTNGAPANGNTLGASLSTDGLAVIIESDANNLAPGDTNTSTDLYVYDVASGKISLINPGSDGNSGAPIITPDGRFILYESDATNLSPVDTNGVPDLYLFDRQTGTNRLVTVNFDNSAASGGGAQLWAPGEFQTSVSDDGRYVVFLSSATDLVPGMSAARSIPQVYLRDTVENTTILLTKDSRGNPSTSVSYTNGDAEVSGDGQWVVFRSQSFLTTNILSGAYNYLFNIPSNTFSVMPTERPLAAEPGERILSSQSNFLAYVHGGLLYLQQLGTGTNRLITANDGITKDLSPTDLLFSSNGRFLVFRSSAPVTGTNDLGPQVYVFDILNGTNLLASVSNSGAVSSEPLLSYSVADDGKFAFASSAQDLGVDGDPIGFDVFISDILGSQALVCASQPNARAASSTVNGRSWLGANAVSADGRWIAYTSEAVELTTNIATAVRNIYLHDVLSKSNRLVTLTADGLTRTNASRLIAMSADARRLAYFSKEADDRQDSIFVYDTRSDTTTLASVLPNGDRTFVGPGATLSADGRYLAFFVVNQFFRRDLESGVTETLSPGDVSATPLLSASGRYFIALRPGNGFQPFDTATGQFLNPAQDLPLANSRAAISADESTALFFSGSRNSSTGLLCAYSLQSQTSLIIASNALPPAALSANGSIALYQLLDRDGSNLVKRVFITELAARKTSELLPDESMRFELKGESMLMSDDARYVLLSGKNKTPDAVLNGSNLYLFDRSLTNLIQITQRSTESSGSSGNGSLSADGRLVAFQTMASGLVPADLNNGVDLLLVHVDITDLNGNGIDDGWELLYPALGDMNGDSDEDGASNRAEYLAGTNPTLNGSALRFSIETTNAEKLVIIWDSVRGKRYRIEATSSLEPGHWLSISDPIVAIGTNTALEIPRPQSYAFYRISLIEN